MFVRVYTIFEKELMLIIRCIRRIHECELYYKGRVISQCLSSFLNRVDFGYCCRKLNHVLTNRLIKFFQDQAKKDPVKYNEFYEDYGLYFREGVLTTPEQELRVTTLPHRYCKLCHIDTVNFIS